MSVIANNTVITNLAMIDRLDLLEKLFVKVYISFEVYKEVEEGIEYGYDFQYRTKQVIYDHEWLFVTGVDTPEVELFRELREFLHDGEASCLAIAKNRKMLFLTDDGDARDYAEKSNIALSGTIGVLRESVYARFITLDQGEEYHEIMVNRGFRSPVRRLKDAL